MKRSSHCCEIANIPSVVRTKSKKLLISVTDFGTGYWRTAVVLAVMAWIPSRLTMWPKRGTCSRKDSHLSGLIFKFASVKRWKLQKTLNRFFSSSRKNNAIVQVWNYAFPRKADQDFFHQRVENERIAGETQWHNKPFERTKRSTAFCITLTTRFWKQLVQLPWHVDNWEVATSFQSVTDFFNRRQWPPRFNCLLVQWSMINLSLPFFLRKNIAGEL